MGTKKKTKKEMIAMKNINNSSSLINITFQIHYTCPCMFENKTKFDDIYK